MAVCQHLLLNFLYVWVFVTAGPRRLKRASCFPQPFQANAGKVSQIKPTLLPPASFSFLLFAATQPELLSASLN